MGYVPTCLEPQGFARITELSVSPVLERTKNRIPVASGDILDSISQKPIAPIEGNMAIIGGPNSGGISLIIKRILDSLAEGAKVIIADSPAEIPSIYSELSSVFSVLGYKVGTYYHPLDVEYTDADVMLVGVSRRRPKQTVKPWADLLWKVSRSNPKTLLVITDSSKLTSMRVFKDLLLRWVSSKSAGLNVIFQQQSPKFLSLPISKYIDSFLIRDVKYNEIFDLEVLGFPESRLYAYYNWGPCDRDKQRFKSRWLLSRWGRASDIVYAPPAIVLGMCADTHSAIQKRNTFFDFYPDPVEAFLEFSRSHVEALKERLSAEDLKSLCLP